MGMKHFASGLAVFVGVTGCQSPFASYGLSLKPVSGQSTQKDVVVASPTPSSTPTPSPTPTVTVKPTPSPTPSPTPAPSPTPTVTVKPTPSPTPSPTPTPSPSVVMGNELSTAEPAVYSPPLIITKGGTYTGNYQTTEMGYSSGAIKVQTAEPVIIQNCHLAGPGILLNARYAHSNVTVRNCSFHGKTPTADNVSRGRAIDANIFANLRVENNFFENTGQVVAADNYVGDGSANETLTVRYNRVKNINGLWRNQTGCPAEGCYTWQNFIAHFNNVQPQGNPRYGEIAWNEMINEPGLSATGDIINFYMAGGRADSYFKIHNNYLQGSYPSSPSTNPNSAAGGIQIDGKDHTKTAYIDVYNNTITQILIGGMGVAAGSHIHMHHNRVISSGKDSKGNWWPANYGGVWLYDEYKGNAIGKMEDILIDQNVIGWASKTSNSPYPNRYDITSDQLGGVVNNTFLPNEAITYETEMKEYQLFLDKVKNAGIKLGPTK